MDLFFQIHQNLPREGPGDDEFTERALRMIELPTHPEILDIGSGPGMQTIALARLTGGHIVATDTHQPFLDVLKQRAQAAGLDHQIETHKMSMFALDFEEHSFDLIWSEGAVYIIGFDQGLNNWRPYLKPHAYLVISEISWLKQRPPREVYEFWKTEYPGMRMMEDNLAKARKAGYCVVGSFVLPESAWWENYYLPMERQIDTLLKKYKGDKEAKAVLNDALLEIEMYRKHSEWYGYVFYVLQVEEEVE